MNSEYRWMVRYRGKHSKDCSAMKEVASGRWEFPWCNLVDEVEWLSERGDKRGQNTPWLIIRCNCLKCPAIKMVHADIFNLV